MTTKNRRKAERERQRRQQTLLVIGAAAIAVVAVVVWVILSGSGGGDEEKPVTDSAGETGSGLTAEGYPYLGSPNAPVKVIEYSDYFCGHCAGFNADKAPRIEEEYVTAGKVQFIVQYYALGKDARLSVVEASACAADQGHFFEYQRLLFNNQRHLAETPPDQWKDLLVQYAQQVGLDVATFETCWDQGQHQAQILASIDDALQKGISSTPTFSINGELVIGNLPYETFQEVINKALAEALE